MAAAAGIVANAATPPSVLPFPLHLLTDGKAKLPPALLSWFWGSLWPQSWRDFSACGIRFQASATTGSIERPPGREPIVSGLARGVLNLALTDRIPMEWDQGRTLSGVTTRYRGYHLCVVALDRAHGHQVPFLSVNTCTHELLHAIMLDIFEDCPEGLAGQAREFRIDCYATRLWLLRSGSEVRKSAQLYLQRAS